MVVSEYMKRGRGRERCGGTLRIQKPYRKQNERKKCELGVK